MNKKIILGDGLLGSEMYGKTEWDYISRKKDGIDFVNLDSYSHLLNSYDTVINCIADTNTYDPRRENHWDVNFKGVVNLVDFCRERDKKLIHISTDYLYTYSKSNASEEDVPIHCNNWYGYTKLLADGYVQLKSDRYLIIRGTHKKSPFLYEYAWLNQCGNFDYVSIICDLIISLIQKNANGVYNVGTELKSMYDLAKKTFPEVKPTMQMNEDSIPKDTSMDISKMKGTLS